MNSEILQIAMNLCVVVSAVIIIGIVVIEYAMRHDMHPLEKLMCWLTFIICGMSITIYFSLVYREFM